MDRITIRYASAQNDILVQKKATYLDNQKKRYFIVLILFIFYFISCSYSKSNNNQLSGININNAEGKNILIDVNKKGIFINSMQVNSKMQFSEIQSLLGVPDKIKIQSKQESDNAYQKMGTNINNIYTYDKLGLLIYQKPNTKTISSIAIDFKKQSYSFSPKSTFQGILRINGTVISYYTSLQALKEIPSLSIENSKHRVNSGSFNNYSLVFEFSEGSNMSLLSTFEINLNNEKEKTNQKGWKSTDIEMLKAIVRNNPQTIQYSKDYNFNISDLLDCYIPTITNTIELKDFDNPSPECLKKIKDILQSCIIAISKNK